ncbi:MAG: cytochrome c oxidase subunit 4 [Actinomycetes bacterium]
MKAGWRLFSGLSVFYFLVTIIYWQVGGEALGITAIMLSGGLAGLIGFYLWFISKRTNGVLPEDNEEGEIADAAGELGFYSPHSWWPLPLALSVCAAGMGLLIGWWLTLIAVGGLMISVVGFVLEYEKPSAISGHH